MDSHTDYCANLSCWQRPTASVDWQYTGDTAHRLERPLCDRCQGYLAREEDEGGVVVLRVTWRRGALRERLREVQRSGATGLARPARHD
jgi:hypothetical protein